MTQLSISLPEDITLFLQSQIHSGNYSTPSDYIQTLIQQDQSRKAYLEPLMLEALESPATPMNQDDWDHIRVAVRQNLSKVNPHA